MSYDSSKVARQQPPQNIHDVNQILQRVVTSKKNQKLYIVLDSKSELVGVTYDKKHASSMGKVSSWINQISKQLLNNKEVDKSEARQLHAQFGEILKKNKPSFFQRIAESILIFFGNKSSKLMREQRNETNRQIEESLDALEKNLYTYGKREDHSMKKMTLKTVGYSKHAEHEMKARKEAASEIDQFEQINASGGAESDEITQAFYEELYKEFKPKFAEQNAGMKLVDRVFKEELEKMADEIGKMSPKIAVKVFRLRVIESIKNKNNETLELDRETFRDLMGDRVMGGKGQKIPDEMNPRSPAVKKLIEDYNSGNWEIGEERTLNLEIMDEPTRKKMDAALDKIFGRAENMLFNYFTQIKKQPNENA